MIITSIEFKKIIISIADEIEKNVGYLTDLDAEIGDGDHGINMNKGFKKIKEQLINSSTADIGEMLIIAGKVLLNEIGGAMGPLYGGGFIKAGNLLKGKDNLNEFEIYDMFSAILSLMKSIAPGEVGDKTLIDTLEPFVIEYKKLMESNDLLFVFKEALVKAKEGMVSTKGMLSKYGRSSRLMERSIGHIDVGAASCYLILETFYKSLGKI